MGLNPLNLTLNYIVSLDDITLCVFTAVCFHCCASLLCLFNLLFSVQFVLALLLCHFTMFDNSMCDHSCTRHRHTLLDMSKKVFVSTCHINIVDCAFASIHLLNTITTFSLHSMIYNCRCTTKSITQYTPCPTMPSSIPLQYKCHRY